MNYNKPPHGFLKLQQRQNITYTKKRVRQPKIFNYHFIIYTVKDISKFKTFIYFLKQKFQHRIFVKGLSALKEIKSSYDPFDLQTVDDSEYGDTYNFEHIRCNIKVYRKTFKIKLVKENYYVALGSKFTSKNLSLRISFTSITPIEILKDCLQDVDLDYKLIKILKNHS